MKSRSWRRPLVGATLLVLVALAAIGVLGLRPSSETLSEVFEREQTLEDDLPNDGAIEGVEADLLESRLLLDDGSARYWIVRLPENQERSICIVLQSAQVGHAGISCVSPEQFSKRGVGVVLKGTDLAHAGLIRPETAVLPEDSEFESKGALIHLTTAAEGADQLVIDYVTMKDELTR